MPDLQLFSDDINTYSNAKFPTSSASVFSRCSDFSTNGFAVSHA